MHGSGKITRQDAIAQLIARELAMAVLSPFTISMHVSVILTATYEPNQGQHCGC